MPKPKKKPSKTYTYVMHVTETVEYRAKITSKRKLTYDEIKAKAEEDRIEDRLEFAGVSDVVMFLEEAKPGKDAVARG